MLESLLKRSLLLFFCSSLAMAEIPAGNYTTMKKSQDCRSFMDPIFQSVMSVHANLNYTGTSLTLDYFVRDSICDFGRVKINYTAEVQLGRQLANGSYELDLNWGEIKGYIWPAVVEYFNTTGRCQKTDWERKQALNGIACGRDQFPHPLTSQYTTIHYNPDSGELRIGDLLGTNWFRCSTPEERCTELDELVFYRVGSR